MKDIIINMLGYEMFIDFSKHAWQRSNTRLDNEIKENLIERIKYILQIEDVADYALFEVKTGDYFVVCDHTMNFSVVMCARQTEVEILTVFNEDAFGSSIKMFDGQGIIDIIDLENYRFSRFDRFTKRRRY